MKLPWHRHVWAESERTFMVSRGDTFTTNGPKTLITYKCSECGSYKQKLLDGNINN